MATRRCKFIVCKDDGTWEEAEFDMPNISLDNARGRESLEEQVSDQWAESFGRQAGYRRVVRAFCVEIGPVVEGTPIVETEREEGDELYDAVELLLGSKLHRLTAEQVAGLKEGRVLNEQGFKISSDDLSIVQMLPVWWPDARPGEEISKEEGPGVAYYGGWEWDSQVGPMWLEFGGRSYRIPDDLLFEHLG